jgi:hypothetical protein
MSSKTWKEKLAEIQDGWSNWIWKNEEVEEIAKQRATVCSKCDSNVANTCKECGCPLFAKTRSMKDTNSCPLNKWKK